MLYRGTSKKKGNTWLTAGEEGTELKEQRTNGMDGETEGPRGIDVDRVVSAVLDGQRITMACVLDIMSDK